jgi:hypothetical protein
MAITHDAHLQKRYQSTCSTVACLRLPLKAEMAHGRPMAAAGRHRSLILRKHGAAFLE